MSDLIEELQGALQAAQSFIADGGFAESEAGEKVYRLVTKAIALIPSMKGVKFSVGDEVYWTSSNTKKTGVVLGIVPARITTNKMGFKIDGGFGLYREHESYVVKGGRVGGKQTTVYWPLVSLLHKKI